MPARLKRLMSCLLAEIDIVDALTSDMRFDFQCHMMSLPHRLQLLGHDAFPTAPWMAAEPELVAKWRDKIGTTGLRVGVAWRGSNNDRRSYDPSHLASLAKIPGVRLISLHTEEAVPPDTLPPHAMIETLGPDFDSGADGFVDTAAVMESVDLVVSCDTAIAHLAGALNRPVWIALNEAPEWRWQRHSVSSVWYSSARLYRQHSSGDWDGVFRVMAADLSGPAKV